MDDVTPQRDFPRLIADLRAGDPDAARVLFDTYGPVIRAAVRRKLHARLRTRFDSLDFVQDVWASVVAMPPDSYDFPTPEALAAFLSRVANNKVVDTFRQRFQTQKHAIIREEPLPPPCGEIERGEPPAAGGTPSQFAIATEEWEKMVARVPARHRPILDRLRYGYTLQQIAAETNTSLSTVNRVVRRLRDLSGL